MPVKHIGHLIASVAADTFRQKYDLRTPPDAADPFEFELVQHVQKGTGRSGFKGTFKFVSDRSGVIKPLASLETWDEVLTCVDPPY